MRIWRIRTGIPSRQLERLPAPFARHLSRSALSGYAEYEKVSFKQLNRKTGHRIKYAKVDADAGEEVANEECRSDLYNWMKRMAPTYHPTPASGGDRQALAKELDKARAMANILASQSVEMRLRGQADRLLCESWNERMWSDGEPIDPSRTITRPSTAAFHGWKSSMRGIRASHKIWGMALDDRRRDLMHEEPAH